MLEICNLRAGTGGIEILNGLNLSVKAGEVHAIMGPNGSGKSTLAYVLAGHPNYNVTSGEIIFQGSDISGILPEKRAQEGLFLSFQHPPEISGVRLNEFLRAGSNAILRSKKSEELDVLKFDKLLKKKMSQLDVNPDFAKRSVNEGFSGGERKRNEILQMAIMEPQLAILDEPDSGLDVDAVRQVADGINQLRDPDRAIILITHYQRILNYVIPDVVHVLIDGLLVKTGGKDLAKEVEADGYDKLQESVASIRARD